MNENPTINTSYNDIHPDLLKELQTVLSNCFEDIWNVKGASGQGKPRRLQFLRHNLDPPAPSVDDEAPALWIHPVPAGEAFAAAGAGAGSKGKKKK